MQLPSENSTENKQNTPAAPAAEINFDDVWQKYRPMVVGVAVLAVVYLLINAVLTSSAERTNAQVQKEYLAIMDDAGRAAFAKRHPQHPLGGMVLLNLAQSYYSQGNHEAACTAFEQALNGGLKNQPALREQALLGQAFCWASRDAQKGREALAGLVRNSELMDATRAYAAYELAGYYIAQKDWKNAKDYLDVIDTLAHATSWKRQVKLFREVYPQLAE